MVKAILLKNVDGYEALYIHGRLYNQGNPIEEGMERVIYFLNLAEELNFNIKEVRFGFTNTFDIDEYGEFPCNLEELPFNKIVWEN